MSILNADIWITDKLKKDTTLLAAVSDRIFQDEAPSGIIFPLIIFNFVSTTQVENACADRIMDEEIWRINVITNQPTYKSIGPLADQIRAIFHKASGTGVIGCKYTGSYRLYESRDEQVCKSIILEFELFTQ